MPDLNLLAQISGRVFKAIWVKLDYFVGLLTIVSYTSLVLSYQIFELEVASLPQVSFPFQFKN